MNARWLCCLVWTLNFSAANGFAETSRDNRNDSFPVVAGFERFVEDDRFEQVEKGLLLINELNCTSCHISDANFWAAAPRVAPKLNGVGKRVQAEYFESFVRDPRGIKPGTTMPDVMQGKTDSFKKEAANTIAHFLASTGKTAHQPTMPQEIERGKQLYHTVGCVACHDPQSFDQRIATSVPLGDLSEKYTVPGLSRFLRDPLHARPSGRMPKIKMSSDDVRSIAAYLLRDVKVDGAIRYELYEGTWNKLPDFEALTPVETGTVPTLDVTKFSQADQFGVVFTGFWEVAEELKVKFRLGSDDGSRVMINGEMILENDGLHAMKFVQVQKAIPAGVHEVRIEFFENAGGEELRCTIETAETGRQNMETVLRKDRKPPEPAKNGFVLDLEKAKQGAVHFQELGCANCHELEQNEKRLPSTMVSTKRLDGLNISKGCVANKSSTPNYQFNRQQQIALRAALEAISENTIPEWVDDAMAAQSKVHQQFASLNCYACHSRETGSKQSDDIQIVGGVTDKTGGDSLEVYGRDAWFTGNEPEMGDEGRHPPDLKLVGAKLRREWMEKLFNKSSVDRPNMNTRMPRFGTANVSGLIDDLIAADKLPRKIEVAQTKSAKKVKSHGRFLTGAGGLSCIKCHTFGEFKSTGVQAIDLTTMTERLNQDWFQLYMLKPSFFRRGTRMPESWPNGKTFYPDMLDGNIDRQIDAIWQYLSDGTNAATPKGLVKGKMELVAREFPIVYRNFIEGAGPRAIGVGYPELVNLAFDADNCRMAMFWQENFIDAARHWTGRGEGFQPPLGENLIRFPESTACFDGELEAWPQSTDKESAREQGLKFLGYSFDKQRRPAFQYRYKDSKISDRPIPFVEDQIGMLRRKFKIVGGRPFVIRAIDGINVVAGKEGFVVDDNITVAIRGDVKTRIQTIHGKQALLVEVDPTSGPVTFEQEIRW